MTSRFDKPSSVVVPQMVQLVPEAKGITTADLNNPNHPVNINSQSGKRAGMALMIGSKVYIATGIEPHDPWDAAGTGGGSSGITVDAASEQEAQVSGITLGDGMSYELKGTKAVLHAAVSEQEHAAVLQKAEAAQSEAEGAKQSVQTLKGEVDQNKQDADNTKRKTVGDVKASIYKGTNIIIMPYDLEGSHMRKSSQVNLTQPVDAITSDRFVSVVPDKATKTIKFVTKGGTEHTVDLSDWFSDGGGGTEPTVKHHVLSGFFPKGGTKDEATIKAGLANDRYVASADKLWIDDTRTADGGGTSAKEDKYMFVWIDDRLGDARGFEFSGFLSVWSDITPVTVDGNAGKLYISPNPTFAAEVSYQIIMK